MYREICYVVIVFMQLIKQLLPVELNYLKTLHYILYFMPFKYLISLISLSTEIGMKKH